MNTDKDKGATQMGSFPSIRVHLRPRTNTETRRLHAPGIHRDWQRPGEQPEERLPAHSQGQDHDLHRSIRLGEIVDRVRHVGDGGPAPALRSSATFCPSTLSPTPTRSKTLPCR